MRTVDELRGFLEPFDASTPVQIMVYVSGSRNDVEGFSLGTTEVHDTDGSWVQSVNITVHLDDYNDYEKGIVSQTTKSKEQCK
jgi:hypothetical protein